MRFSSRLSRYTRAADWSDKGVTQTINSWSEVYTVKPAVWKAAGMEPMDGCLCIGCLEQRLGRTLTARDFPSHPLNTVHGKERLLSRRRLTPTITPSPSPLTRRSQPGN